MLLFPPFSAFFSPTHSCVPAAVHTISPMADTYYIYTVVYYTVYYDTRSAVILFIYCTQREYHYTLSVYAYTAMLCAASRLVY